MLFKNNMLQEVKQTSLKIRQLWYYKETFIIVMWLYGQSVCQSDG